MSGQEKTEQPTSKRLSEARKKGQIPKSHDLVNALVMGGIALVLNIYGASFFEYLIRVCRQFLHFQLRQAVLFTPETFLDLFQQVIWHFIIIVAPFMLGAMAVGIVANCLQVRFLFTLETLKPNFNKLNPFPGFKRLLFSQRSLVELAKGILKMAIVGYCGYWVIAGRIDHLMGLGQMGFAEAWSYIFQTVLAICLSITFTMLAIGILDYWYQHYSTMKSLKMTKQEVKDEMKNAEGNPEVKQKVKMAGRQMMQKRMLKALETADVVVTNPTHFAVAIQYDPDEAPAPRVVAKGVDHFALKMREVAKEHKIPIMENKPLARSLYAAVEVDHMIPPELFVAVAEVLAYVFKKYKARRRGSVKKMATGGGGLSR